MAVTTGDNSLANAKANTPPTDLVNPNLANSRTNCQIGTECQTLSTESQKPFAILIRCVESSRFTIKDMKILQFEAKENPKTVDLIEGC